MCNCCNWGRFGSHMPATYTCGVLQAYVNTHRRFVGGVTGSHKRCQRYAGRVDWSSTFPAGRRLSGGVLCHFYYFWCVNTLPTHRRAACFMQTSRTKKRDNLNHLKKPIMDTIHNYRAIYDKSYPEYKNQRVKTNAWQAVATSLGMDGIDHGFYAALT